VPGDDGAKFIDQFSLQTRNQPQRHEVNKDHKEEKGMEWKEKTKPNHKSTIFSYFLPILSFLFLCVLCALCAFTPSGALKSVWLIPFFDFILFRPRRTQIN
jgi:hypothetical protein